MIRLAAPVILLIFGMLISRSEARINRVPDNFRTIQEAIDRTHDGDTIIVAPGTYNESLVFNGRNIVVGSHIIDIGGDVWIGETVIVARRNSSVIQFQGEIAEQSTIRGFTLMGGNAGFGGGISVGSSTTPTIKDLVITGNQAVKGGGIYVSSASPIISNVTVQGNDATESGGGFYFLRSISRLNDCRILENTAASGAGCATEASDIDFVKVLIANNVSEEGYSLYLWGGRIRGGESTLNHVTIAGNTAGDGRNAGILINTETADNITLTIRNSILWNNHGLEIAFQGRDNEWDGLGLLSINYTDLDGGLDTLLLNDSAFVEVGEGVIEENPRFVLPVDRDFRLNRESPCINAGDPEDTPDADGSTTDLGALGIRSQTFRARGVVVDSENNNPIPLATGLGFAEGGFVCLIECDNLGSWWVDFPEGLDRLSLRIKADRYLTASQEVELNPNDTGRIITRLDHSLLVASTDTISALLNYGESRSFPYHIRNEGNGTLTWRTEVQNPGESGLPQWTIRQQIDAGALTGSTGIQSGLFVRDRFYVAGSSARGNNLIWIFNREGELIDSLEQPGSSRTGFRDMEWDGNLIWAVDGDSAFAFDTRGRLRTNWRIPGQNITNITYQPDEGILWLCGTTTEINRFDLEGNMLGRTVFRNGMRIYGLGWLPDQVNNHHLIVLNKPDGEPAWITMIDHTNSDTTNLRPVGFDSDASTHGLTIGQDYDAYAGSVMLVVQNIPANEGGDRLDIIQSQPNRQWIITDPPSGEIPPGSEGQIRIYFNTMNVFLNWGLKGGDYTGELVFQNDGRSGDFILPVTLEVIPLEAGEPEIDPLPLNAAITSLYPQPFNASLAIEYSLPASTPVTIRLYSTTGREVRSIYHSSAKAGLHHEIINGESLSSGLYFLRIEGEFGSIGRKVVLLR